LGVDCANVSLVIRIMTNESPCAASPAARLAMKRHLRKLSQVDLAQLAGVSAGAIAMIEIGQRQGRLSTWRKLAAALRVRVSALIDGAR
jgi:transcriptional regulator with XRE-family HTH domain